MAKDIKKIFPEYIAGRKKVFRDGNDKITVKTFGVTSLLFDDGKTKILFDAMVTRPCILNAYLGKIDSDRALVQTLIREQNMGDLSAIFVSHSHYDHVFDVPAFAQETGAQIYSTVSTLNVARGNGVREEKLQEFHEGEIYQVGEFQITVIRSVHSPAKWYNNDLGIEISEPISYPVNGRKLTEGGSYDFYVVHGKRSFLIRPSCNYIPDTFDHLRAEVLFFGVGQMAKMDEAMKKELYRETVRKIRPRLVMPIHWDAFMLPYGKADYVFTVFDRPADGMNYLIDRLEQDGIRFEILLACRTSYGKER